MPCNSLSPDTLRVLLGVTSSNRQKNALINTRRQVYEHYTYARTNNDALALIEDNGTDNDDGDEGDLELDNFMERD